MRKALPTFLVAVAVTIGSSAVTPLITGGEGNKPLKDPGWPEGAAAIFNHKGRVAWWEGPPFGGGQWHSECRGDVKSLNAVLAEFARLDIPNKRIVAHDGAGNSFWLNPNREPEKGAKAQIDWSFMVWVEENWKRLRGLPPDLNPIDPSETTPPAQMDIYTARIRWADVVIPTGVELTDQRLEAHGFTTADGVVMEGKLVDLDSNQPLAATIELQRVEPQKTGGYRYPKIAETPCDAQGHWVIKHAPEGWIRVVASAKGFVPRLIAHAQFDDQPRWEFYDSGLTRASSIAGRVLDDAGKPLADVDVRLANVVAATGAKYETPDENAQKTDAGGRFQFTKVPAGKATVWVTKPGFVRPGLGLDVTMPSQDVELAMIKAANARVTVDFTNADRPEGYIVKMTPEGGDVVGSYGGSGNIDAKNTMNFENFPPGRYTFTGRPNPGSDDQETEAVTVDFKGGETTQVTLKAK